MSTFEAQSRGHPLGHWQEYPLARWWFFSQMTLILSQLSKAPGSVRFFHFPLHLNTYPLLTQAAGLTVLWTHHTVPSPYHCALYLSVPLIPPWKLYESFSLLSYLWAFNYSLPYSLPANCFLYTDLASLKETVKSLRASIKGLSRHQLPHFDKVSCHDGKAHRARNWGWSPANSQQGTEALHPASL